MTKLKAAALAVFLFALIAGVFVWNVFAGTPLWAEKLMNSNLTVPLSIW
jgi:hypothetical protein